jgi:LPS sulfotransferase NodH
MYPLSYIRGLSKMRSSDNFICHVKINQLTRNRKHPIDPAKFLNALYNDGWKIIYLRRKNKLRQALSGCIAKHRGTFHKFNDEKEEFTLSIDCDKFVASVNNRLWLDAAEREALANIKYHEVIYEDHLECQDAHQLTINRILDYVSLEHQAVTTNHRKINTYSLPDLIVNYDEFVNCLIKHKWQGFLES